MLRPRRFLLAAEQRRCGAMAQCPICLPGTGLALVFSASCQFGIVCIVASCGGKVKAFRVLQAETRLTVHRPRQLATWCEALSCISWSRGALRAKDSVFRFRMTQNIVHEIEECLMIESGKPEFIIADLSKRISSRRIKAVADMRMISPNEIS